ncbi:MAG: NAD(P)-binding domain-containing protein, partial [Acidobacteria bacterium]|nr:NAD(P)-binding domain-containing protein [Acidobacteriota bacterium]
MAKEVGVMQLGMVGLGRMGGNMVRRLMKGGHACVVYDRNPENVEKLAGEGATGTKTLDEFVKRLSPPRAAWVMVPAGDATEQTVLAVAERMTPGDIIIDGGNSYYKDDVRRAKGLRQKGIHYVDVGTSGGIWGVER